MMLYAIQVNWDFVLFDNSLLWLLQFADYYGNPVTFNDLEKGSAKYGYGHMAFWVSNSINPYQVGNTKYFMADLHMTFI